MVIHVSSIKSKHYILVLEDTQQVVKACGEKPVKVIIETALLTDTEKIADLSTNDSWHNRLEWRR